MNDIDRHRLRQDALVLWAGFYRCPNTGRVIEALHGDDKALCSCRRPSPAVPTEYPGCHVVRLLDRATVDDYLDQCAADEAARKEQTTE